MSSFALGAIGWGFADRTHAGVPKFDFHVCAEVPGIVRTDLGLPMPVPRGLDLLAEADLVVVLPGHAAAPRPSPAVTSALRAAYRREAIIVAFCAGAYLLADAQLLDGRRATTHGDLIDDFAARFPQVSVVPDALYIDEGRVVTGAGGAAGLDLFMHLLRREHGAPVADAIAREMLTAPNREGEPVRHQYQPGSATGAASLRAVIQWLHANLDKQVSISDLAARALMSERTFNRQFKAFTGSTPYAWLLTRRLHRAAELLEATNLSIQQIARSVGFNTHAAFRQRFARLHGISPRAYRQKLQHDASRAEARCAPPPAEGPRPP
ncbi:GlxA family transcriptional regulator [Nonomuraea sp. SBT364]|uniref:GlxA family transcriptional regulator n=1 Tax=Nonomuraea sp. SBT364 TaxID=1580530 RepID=UPI00069FCF12|nr:helix-turn-helix domain-containing protein [Nonomuraea sp. SBT364]